MLIKLGKLLKYEFRYYFRILPSLYLVLALAALSAGFQMRQSDSHQGLLTLVWAALIIAIMVITFVLIIQRFTDNLLKNPGYLMFTLPVTPWTLTASKALASLCTILMSALSLTISALIYTTAYRGQINIGNINFRISDLQSIGSPAEIVIFVLIGFIMILEQICLFYAIITASRMLPRFRFAAGAVMYFLITYHVQQPVFRLARSFQNHGDSFYSYRSLLAAVPYGITALAFTALFFWLTGFLLQRKLNLE